uniref:Cadmium ion transporter n=1 Tax=Kwoniella pini CBS 10737 TaxID=1296096 RepID=A0A1B9HXN3_9TREE|nr:uncharacterized protein I206_05894 [Kwoniella pini CBS 10737]OCF48027.1 hypothetical protein I206_05894 [Kwoniella pini CBS 10737]
MPVPFYDPSPAPDAVFQHEKIPLERANIFSRFLYTWISPMLKVGYSRPLQIEDLWSLSEDLKCQTHAERLQKHFMRRMPPSRRPKSSQNEETPLNGKSAVYNEKQGSTDTRYKERDEIENNAVITTSETKIGEPSPEHIKLYGKKKAQKIAYDTLVIEDGKEYDMSLWYAGYFAFWHPYWTAVILNVFGKAIRVAAPLVTKKLIEYLTISHDYYKAQQDGTSLEGLEAPQKVGYGIGLAIALFAMQFIPSLLFYKADQVELIMSSQLKMALVDLISRKSMRLSGKAKNEMTNGRLITLVSSDCSIVAYAMTFFGTLFFDTFTIAAGVALLIYNLGYPALVGVAIVAVAGPAQWWMAKKFMVFSDRQEQHTDKRVGLLTEVLNNVRAVKLYAYERFFGEKVSKIRRHELQNLRGKALSRAGLTAILNVIPTFAAILTFVTYGLTNHPLNAAVIFSGLQWFAIIRVPVALLPMTVAAIGDMAVSLGRIRRALKAEELVEKLHIESDLEYGIDVQADFRYDASPKHKNDTKTGEGKGAEEGKSSERKRSRKEKRAEAKIEKEKDKKRKKLGMPMDVDPDEDDLDVPFSLTGALVCVVGRVGTGKTTLLHGLINEVRKTAGHAKFGGRVSYVPQQAWVQSGTVRDNITFASRENDVDQTRINETIFACALQSDIENWEYGDQTKVGEKGITLSGGQRQRLCLARAAYDHSEIVLLDDPLSAVDAAVGHHLLANCILKGPFADRTRILVTHHLDVLPRADLVLVLDRLTEHEGRIVQQGTYAELRHREGIFRSLMEEFGTIEKLEKPTDNTDQLEIELKSEPTSTQDRTGQDTLEEEKKPEIPKKSNLEESKQFMDEERITGKVTWSTYLAYFRALNSPFYIAICAASLLLTQASSVGNSLFLGFWTGSSINGFTQGEYMGVYGGLGAAQAFFNFATVFSIALAGMRASFNLFNGGWSAVMRSPVAWHDQTPTGRIISRLSKDIRILDDQFTSISYQLLSNTLIIAGTMGLVIYTYPWLGFMFIPLGCAFYLCTAFYTRTSRELKRVESLIRSNWYTSFSEQLAGLAVIRAFDRQEDFQRRMQDGLNQEQVSVPIPICSDLNVLWLSVRLEALSQGIILMIGIIGVVNRNHVSPERFGVVLTYALQSAYIFTLFVPLWAQFEQDMNCVERLNHYNALSSEALPLLPSDPKSDEWPNQGTIEFQQVSLRYRPELPLVLKDLTFSIQAGEKIGIIGRTGAGKSSVAQALFRTVEVESGKILVDGINLKDLGLETLRSRIAIIPQDAFLFAGTIRDNLDPTSSRSDAELNEALNLIKNHPRVSSTLRDKLNLDASVASDGSNFSAGEKQLLSLIRALSRYCKILLLDEATSSVDPETDSLIQGIIQTEFSNITLLSIAHRLQTVAYYDRILVLDKGQVKEFDTPLKLFDNKTSIFRDLCEKKHIGRDDLVKIKKEAESTKKVKTDTDIL